MGVVRRPSVRKILSRVAVIVGLGLMAKVGYVHAKSLLAQLLLDRAWSKAQKGDQDARPWPWADTRAVARLSAPGHGISMVVLSGANDHSMTFGPGHLLDSAKPGRRGNVVFSAHRETHFSFLEDVKEGDRLILQTQEGVRDYRVEAAVIAHQDDPHFMESTEDRLTLITCWPFHAVRSTGLLRYVVVAKPTDSGWGRRAGL